MGKGKRVKMAVSKKQPEKKRQKKKSSKEFEEIFVIRKPGHLGNLLQRVVGGEQQRLDVPHPALNQILFQPVPELRAE